MRIPLTLTFVILLVSCGGPEPRRPVKVRTGTFIKESAERNKLLLEKEESMIKEIIALDSAHTYYESASGSWYYYEEKLEDDAYTPEPDDLVTLRYNLVDFNQDTLYSMDEIGIQQYKVDKQELFPGLRNSVKLLKEGETATFLFPSSLGFGYHGDNDRIGVNVPLKTTLSILKIEPFEGKEDN